MPLTLRLRFEGRAATLTGIAEDMPVAQFQRLLAEKTGVPPEQQVLKHGGTVPPTLLDVLLGTLVEAGCCDRDTLILEKKPAPDSDVALPVSSTGESSCGSSSKRVREDARSVPAACNQDPRGPELLRAFDGALRAAEAHVREVPDDKHQVFALRKAKAVVAESIEQGNIISLSALHTLPRVGHWVVQQVKDQCNRSRIAFGAESPALKRGRTTHAAAAPTPNKFQWWYIGKDGKPVEDRNSAECKGPLDAQEFRVGILHSSGRMEKAYLLDAKAPPRCPSIPTFPTGRGK